MPKLRSLPIIAVGLLLIVLAPLGCSSDDATTPAPPGDTVAPLVLDISPGDRSLGVGLDDAVEIVFTEAMAQATTDGAVTVTGGVTGLTWDATGRILTLAHATWPEASPVTVQVGTGLTDTAGNPLPQAFSVTFYTTSTTPALLDAVLPGGAAAVICNASPLFYFSEPMNLTSVVNNLAITQAKSGQAVPDFQVGAYDGDFRRVLIEFYAPLDPLSTYTITFGAATQTMGGGTLGAAAATTFTTAAVSDDVGPRILSVVPPVGATVSPDLASLTVTFSEPIADGDVQPTEMAALLDFFAARDPVWNAAGDEMTLYLQRPLPAGVRLYAVFEPGTFRDLVGNGNADADSVSFTVAGTAQPFPVRSDLRLYYSSSGYDGSGALRQTVQDIAGNDFTRVVTQRDADGYTDVVDRWLMAWTGSALQMRGVVDGDGGFTFSTPLTLFHLPMQDEWSGSATVTTGDGTATLDYAAACGGPYREYFGSMKVKAPPKHAIYLDGCYQVEIQYSMTATGQTDPFETGEMVLDLAPGLGLYYFAQYGEDYSVTPTDSWEKAMWCMGAALDDRYEQDER